ncbi:hypothetical protein D3C87_2080900 [compost metagenome]
MRRDRFTQRRAQQCEARADSAQQRQFVGGFVTFHQGFGKTVAAVSEIGEICRGGERDAQ